MNRSPAVIVSIILVFAAALFARRGEILSAILPFLLHFLPAKRVKPQAAGLILRRIAEKNRVQAGEELTLRLDIHCGPNPLALTIDELLPRGLEVVSGEASVLAALKAGETISLEYTLRCSRGIFPLPPPKCTIRPHWGLARINANTVLSDDSITEIVAVPRHINIKSLPISVRKTLVYAGLNPSRRGGDGVYFHDLREYQSGDSLRRIHWPSVARHPDQLITAEFEQERVSDIGIILDAREDSYRWLGYARHLEYGISMASAMAQLLLDMQNRVGLMVYGKYLNFTVPGYGKLQGERIRRSLAIAETGDHSVFKSLDNLPVNLFPQRSQLIFVSPLMPGDGDTLRRLKGRGYSVLVISPDCLSIDAAEENSSAAAIAALERRQLIHRLERWGVTVIDWNLNMTIEQTIVGASGRLRRMSGRGI